jgi:hypothetical protein
MDSEFARRGISFHQRGHCLVRGGLVRGS